MHNRGADGKAPSRAFRIPVSNGIFEQCARIGDAIWLLLWLIDKTTEERNGKGKVLGGMPIRDTTLQDALGISEKTARRWRKKLTDPGHPYIEAKNTGHGYSYAVLRSKKWWAAERLSGQKCPGRVDKNDRSDLPKPASLICPNRQVYIDKAVTKQREERTSADAPTLSPVDAQTSALQTERLWTLTKYAFLKKRPGATFYPKDAQIIQKQIAASTWSENELTRAATEIAETLDGFEIKHAGGILAQKLDAMIERLRHPGPVVDKYDTPRHAPDYLKEPPRGPLTGEELEGYEKETAALREKLGIAETPMAASAAA